MDGAAFQNNCRVLSPLIVAAQQTISTCRHPERNGQFDYGVFSNAANALMAVISDVDVTMQDDGVPLYPDSVIPAHVCSGKSGEEAVGCYIKAAQHLISACQDYLAGRGGCSNYLTRQDGIATALLDIYNHIIFDIQ